MERARFQAIRLGYTVLASRFHRPIDTFDGWCCNNYDRCIHFRKHFRVPTLDWIDLGFFFKFMLKIPTSMEIGAFGQRSLRQACLPWTVASIAVGQLLFTLFALKLLSSAWCSLEDGIRYVEFTVTCYICPFFFLPDASDFTMRALPYTHFSLGWSKAVQLTSNLSVSQTLWTEFTVREHRRMRMNIILVESELL